MTPGDDPRSQRPTPALQGNGVGAIVAAGAASVIGALPAFLLGALAVFVRADLGFSEAALGVAVATYFGVAALFSVASGRIAEHLGGHGALAAAAALGGVSLSGLAVSGTFTALLVSIGVGGLALSFSQVASNLRLADGVRPTRQGLAFGIKQSAMPAAVLLSGAAVPGIAVTVGWRWAFAAGGILALLVSATQLRVPTRAPTRRTTLPRPRTPVRGPLLTLAVAGSFASAAATAMAAFMVEFAVWSGLTPETAGVALIIASTATVTARVGLGWVADRRPGAGLLMMTGMLVVGAVAVGALPATAGGLGLTVGAVVGYAIGWGWPGVFTLTVVRRNPRTPATATGITQTGIYLGGMTGPLVFGVIVTQSGYTNAWLATAASFVVGAVLIARAHLRGARHR